MSTLTRRGLLIGGATVAAVALSPEIAQANPTPSGRTVRFTLNGTVLDGGEQVTSLTLDTSDFGPIDPASLTTGTFKVHVKATSPWPVPAGDLIFSEHDDDRPVTKASIVHGKIVLELETIDQTSPGGTLGYLLNEGRNVLLKLVYTITQTAPLTTHNHKSLTLPGFTQGRLVDPEVDAYSYHKSSDGMNYRLFSPTQGGGWERSTGRGKRPLVLWLHGGGEGGLLSNNYYDNEPVLRANRGALGFSTAEAQKIFGGAYVAAPQAETYWLENAVPGGPNYSARLMKLVNELSRKYPIDTKRIYVVGCSNGGYMSLELTNVYHDFFAASVPICGVIADFPTAGTTLITDPELAAIDTPSWLVCSAADTTVPPAANTVHASQVIPGVILSEFPTVTRNGITYPGHWSWIYVARNVPEHGGQHVWQWMASKRLSGRR
jgi:predicted peptidase